jgi:hypothetical protein
VVAAPGWRGAQDQRQPELLIVDGGSGLDAALAAVWNDVPVQRCTVHKHRNLLAHAPERLHEEITADYNDMIYAATREEIEARRKAIFSRRSERRRPAHGRFPPQQRFAYQQFVTFTGHEGEKVRSSVASVAQQHMRIFASPRVQRVVATTSFDLGKVMSGAPLTIFIVMPPSKLVSHGALIRLWLSTLLGVITERTTAPARPTVFMVDELAQLGGLRAFKEAVTLLRGYGLRCCLFLQSHAQLKALYPLDHEAITENCGAILTFGHTSMGMSRPIADLLGDVSPEMLFGMTREQIAVRLAGQPTMIARRLDYLKDRLFAGKFDTNPRYR